MDQSGAQLFRLAAVLYADNNYEVAPRTILKKILESALLTQENKPITLHNLIDLISNNYNLVLDEEEVRSIIEKEGENFLVNNKKEEQLICLSQKRKHVIESKVSKKNIEYFIGEFVDSFHSITDGVEYKEVIYRFLYELLNSNIGSFRKLLDNRSTVEELINIETHTYSLDERKIINEFLAWDNNDKNKAIFDIASYGLEYCMISNNGSGSQLHLSNLKNKVFYLDTNVVFRALGINGKNRQQRTITFLNKFIQSESTLVISKFTEIEFKDTIAFYLDKLKRVPITRKISPDIFREKYFNSFSDFYDFYYKWRVGRYNDTLELFEGYIISLYEDFKSMYKVKTDYKIPFDEKDAKIIKEIKELTGGISSFKENNGIKHQLNGDFIDAQNIYLVENKRNGKAANIFEAKEFVVSTDQALRRWDYYRNNITPIVILPSQWLSIILRYVNRSNDDFKSFVSFLNLPITDSPIDNGKLHIILAGISEMTEDFGQQRFIVQSLIQQQFDGILEEIGEEQILEHAKKFAKTELEKRIDDVTIVNMQLKAAFADEVEESSKRFADLKEKRELESRRNLQSQQENRILRHQLQSFIVNEELKKWKLPAYWAACLGGLIVVFHFFEIFFTEWQYNIVGKLIHYIDADPSETKRQLLFGLNIALFGGLISIIIFCYNRLGKKGTQSRLDEINKNLPKPLSYEKIQSINT